MESHAQMAVFPGPRKEAFLSVDTHAPECLTIVQENHLTESFHPTSGTLKTNRTIFKTENNKPGPEHSNCYDPKLESCDWLTISRLWKSHIALLSGQALETVSLTFLIL